MKNWDWGLDSDTLGISLLLMGDAAAFWSANNPSIFTVRAFRRKGGAEADETAKDIRRGAVAGSAMALGVGYGGSLITKSWWPLTATVAVLAFQWALWEWALQNPHPNGKEIASQ